MKDIWANTYISGSASTSQAPAFSDNTKYMDVFSSTDYGKVWQIEFYMNDILKYHFVPAINKYGNVGLWDKVNSKFYGVGKGLNVGSLTGQIVYE